MSEPKLIENEMNNPESSSRERIIEPELNKINQPTLTILGDGRTKRKRSKDSYIEIALEKENYKNSNSNTLNQSRTSKSHSLQRNKTLNTESIDSDRIQFRNELYKDYGGIGGFRTQQNNINYKNMYDSQKPVKSPVSTVNNPVSTVDELEAAI